MQRIFIICVLLFIKEASAQVFQTNSLYGTELDANNNPLVGLTMTSKLLWPLPRWIGNNYYTKLSVQTATDGNGNYQFTNQQYGVYQLSDDNGSIGFYVVYTDTLGSVPIQSLFTNTFVPPGPNPAKTFVTYAQLAAAVGNSYQLTNFSYVSLTNGANITLTILQTNIVNGITNYVVQIASSGGGGGNSSFATNATYAVQATNLAGIATGSIVTNQWQWSLSANSYTNLYQGSNFPDATFNTAYQFAYITNGGDAVYVSTSSPARYLFNYNVSVGNGFALETNNVYDNANAHTNWAYDNYNYGIGLLPSAAGTWEQSVANLNFGTQLPGAAVYGQLYSVVLANNAGLTVNGNTTLKTVAATTSTVGTETVGTGSFTNLSSQGGGNVMTTNNPYVYPATTSVAPFFDWFGDSIFTTNTGGLGTIGVPQNFQFVSDTGHIMRNTNWFSDAIAGWPVSWLATNQIPGGIPNSGPWTNGLLYSALFHSTNNPYQTNVMFLESFANDDPGTYAAWQTYIGYFTNLCLNIHKTNGIYLVVLCPWTNSWMNTAIYTNTVGNTTNVLLGNTNLYSTLIRSDLYFSTNQADLTSGPHPNPVGTAQPRFCAWLTSQLPSWFTNAWVPVPSVVPASALTGTVQAAQLNGVTGLNITNAVTLTNAGNSFAGSGAGLTGITTTATNLSPIVATNLGASTFFTVVNNGQAGGTANVLNLVNMSGNNAIAVSGQSDGASGQTNVQVQISNLAIKTNTTPPMVANGFGYFWPSNGYDLYWVTPTKTNLIILGH